MPDRTKQAVSTNNTEPPAFQKPYIEYGMQQAKDIYQNQTPQYFPGSTVAGFSPEQTQAQQMGAARAIGGNAGMDLAEGYNSDVLRGKYLNDPNEDAMFGSIMQRVAPAVNSQFMGSGRSGSGLHADTLGRGITEAWAPYATQMRQFGLGQMDAAANRAPTYAANDYTDINALSQIGQQKQGLAQNELQDAINRWNFQQDMPANKLQQYSGLVGGSYGGNTTTSTPYQSPSIWSQLGGAALSGGGLLGSLGWAPFG